jgi:small subunit ribosomal protein S8
MSSVTLTGIWAARGRCGAIACTNSSVRATFDALKSQENPRDFTMPGIWPWLASSRVRPRTRLRPRRPEAINDPFGDMLTRIRNAQMRKRGKVSTPGSSLRKKVLDVLESEGYIRGYSTTDYGDGRTEFEIELKYFDDQPVIRKIERVSKPGRRVYATVGTMPRVGNGLGVAIVSTPKGVMADHSARENNVGGEVLCTVF